MDSKLKQDELGALLALDAGQWRGALEKEAPMPRRLFDFGLVARGPDGELGLSKAGERAVFQHKCVHALGQLAADGTAPDGSVARWLVSSGFVKESPCKITKRGQLWLDSVAEDSAA